MEWSQLVYQHVVFLTQGEYSDHICLKGIPAFEDACNDSLTYFLNFSVISPIVKGVLSAVMVKELGWFTCFRLSMWTFSAKKFDI